MPDDRPEFRLGSWYPPDQYNRPQLEPEAEIRTVEHNVIGEETVVQNMGHTPETFTLRGDAFAEDISTLRTLRGEVVDIRHEVFSGTVFVESVQARSTGSWESEGWVYTYTIRLIGVSGPMAIGIREGLEDAQEYDPLPNPEEPLNPYMD